MVVSPCALDPASALVPARNENNGLQARISSEQLAKRNRSNAKLSPSRWPPNGPPALVIPKQNQSLEWHRGTPPCRPLSSRGMGPGRLPGRCSGPCRTIWGERSRCSTAHSMKTEPPRDSPSLPEATTTTMDGAGPWTASRLSTGLGQPSGLPTPSTAEDDDFF